MQVARISSNRLLFILSFFLTALGTPSISPFLGMLSACFGYALFWKSILSMRSKGRFWLSLAWFTGVQAVQLSWMTSTVYMGPLIWIVYFFLSLGLGTQFALLTLWIRLPLTVSQIAGLAGFWTLMEWSRLFFLTGFTWNPAGLALSSHHLSIQFSSLFGIYGLCFWVMWVNLFALKAFLERGKIQWTLFALWAALPYIYGALQQSILKPFLSQVPEVEVALLQTGMLPEQRDRFALQEHAYVPPLIQWDRILSHFSSKKSLHFDWIILPEGALPFGAKRMRYTLSSMQAMWQSHFGSNAEIDFPPLIAPFAQKEGREWKVSNSFWIQSLANHYDAQVIAGLDDGEAEGHYNAAFHFSPYQTHTERYEKQILIPGGEYIPFGYWQWVARFFAEKMGVTSFKSGRMPKVFSGKPDAGIFICLEETYSHLVREVRRKGAHLFVSISNDVWFPKTRLPWHHFDHGRLRAAEHGVWLLRSCNTGVTAVIDCFGKPARIFPVSERSSGVLVMKLPIQSYSTLYTWMGDLPVIWASALSFACLVMNYLMRRKKLL